ncbi:MAG TPA: hypothetical protein EYN66_22610 [Myxococcales bacterium]|nr:hypothetical protein [Myxococcales bacterium]
MRLYLLLLIVLGSFSCKGPPAERLSKAGESCETTNTCEQPCRCIDRVCIQVPDGKSLTEIITFTTSLGEDARGGLELSAKWRDDLLLYKVRITKVPADWNRFQLVRVTLLDKDGFDVGEPLDEITVGGSHKVEVNGKNVFSAADYVRVAKIRAAWTYRSGQNEYCHKMCIQFGRCKIVKGRCITGVNPDDSTACYLTPYCKRNGQCTNDKGNCVAAKLSDCGPPPLEPEEEAKTVTDVWDIEGPIKLGPPTPGTVACKRYGKCGLSTPETGVCIATSAVDCKNSTECKELGCCGFNKRLWSCTLTAEGCQTGSTRF